MVDSDEITPVETPVGIAADRTSRPCVTIGFSTTNKLISRIIRFVTRGKVSHAWVSFNDSTLGLRVIMQAEWFGFEVRPVNRWRKENKLVAEFELLVPEKDQIYAIHAMAKKLGSRYDWKSGAIAGIAAWVRRWFKSKFSFRPHRSPGKLMCAEAQINFLKLAGVAIVHGLDEETTSPSELLELCPESSQLRIVESKNVIK